MANRKYTPIQLPLMLENANEDAFDIPLTKGYVAVVDAIDSDLALYDWNATTPKNAPQLVYATRSEVVNGKKVRVALHREILSRKVGRALLRSEECDHKDTNPLNNRRDNLRIASRALNAKNRRKSINNKSGYKGVYFDSNHNRWRAQIQVDGRKVLLGDYHTPEEAHKAYCEGSKLYHREFGNDGKR